MPTGVRLTQSNPRDPRAVAKDNGDTMSLRVVLADDHALVRQGLAALLRSEPDIELVGEVGDGEDALQVITACKPDVAVLDPAMPGAKLRPFRRNGHPLVMLSPREREVVRLLSQGLHSKEIARALSTRMLCKEALA
ncbi:response regulator transcription factor [Thiocystis violacea]|uniref:response regulator transcription factor n=1 Tax=Thiocystis violacea TaxID=13725 RepID=UPI001F5B1E42|nr:response regulator [Thiocystis violacea]